MNAAFRMSLLYLVSLFPLSSPAADPAVFTGHYEWSTNAAESTALAAEVDATAATINLFLRPIAHARLTASTAPYATIDIAVGASNTIAFTRSGAPTISGKLGETVKWEREEGVLQDVAFAITPDGKLQQTFSESDGSRVHLYTVEPGGTNMTMEVAIHSKRLERVVKYKLTYVKQPVGGK